MILNFKMEENRQYFQYIRLFFSKKDKNAIKKKDVY